MFNENFPFTKIEGEDYEKIMELMKGHANVIKENPLYREMIFNGIEYYKDNITGMIYAIPVNKPKYFKIKITDTKAKYIIYNSKNDYCIESDSVLDFYSSLLKKNFKTDNKIEEIDDKELEMKQDSIIEEQIEVAEVEDILNYISKNGYRVYRMVE